MYVYICVCVCDVYVYRVVRICTIVFEVIRMYGDGDVCVAFKYEVDLHGVFMLSIECVTAFVCVEAQCVAE